MHFSFKYILTFSLLFKSELRIGWKILLFSISQNVIDFPDSLEGLNFFNFHLRLR